MDEISETPLSQKEIGIKEELPQLYDKLNSAAKKTSEISKNTLPGTLLENGVQGIVSKIKEAKRKNPEKEISDIIRDDNLSLTISIKKDTGHRRRELLVQDTIPVLKALGAVSENMKEMTSGRNFATQALANELDTRGFEKQNAGIIENNNKPLVGFSKKLENGYILEVAAREDMVEGKQTLINDGGYPLIHDMTLTIPQEEIEEIISST